MHADMLDVIERSAWICRTGDLGAIPVEEHGDLLGARYVRPGYSGLLPGRYHSTARSGW